MRVARLGVWLLLFTLAGCVHSSPDAADLAPLAAHLTHEVFDQSNQPDYLVFADQFTASVFRSLRRDARYRIVPPSTGLVCSSKAAEGQQGYLLRARVNQVKGDTAIVTTERMCSGLGGTISTGENYLLVRRSGRWRIETIISGFSTVAM
jgi:hypothetical protein